MNTYDTIHEAYIGTLNDILNNPEYVCAPRGLTIREKLDYSFKVLNPTSDPIVTKDLERNKVIATYTAKEIDLYNSGTNRVEDFAQASKFWNKIANPDGTVNSAYGFLIWHCHSHGNAGFELGHDQQHVYFNSPQDIAIKDACYRTPWEWAKQSLIQDKDTRQAILRFSLPTHAWMGVKDFTCTMHGNFLIREDKLNLSIVMRSNDIVKGITYDLPWFCSLLDKMIEELKPYYPTLTKGTYTHTAHSMHMYEKDIDMVKKMLGHQ